jgi:hypothetical protein
MFYKQWMDLSVHRSGHCNGKIRLSKHAAKVTWWLHQQTNQAIQISLISSGEEQDNIKADKDVLWLYPQRPAVWINWLACHCWQLSSCFVSVYVGTTTVLITGLWGTPSLWTFASVCDVSILKPQFYKIWVLTLLFLKIRIFWDMTLCHWASGSWYFGEPQRFHLQDQVVPDLSTLEDEGSMFFKTLETTHPSE